LTGVEGWGVAEFVEAALDAALVGEVVGLGDEEGFPGPGEDVRVVAADLQDGGVGEPVCGVAVIEEGVEGLVPQALRASRTRSAWSVSGGNG